MSKYVSSFTLVLGVSVIGAGLVLVPFIGATPPVHAAETVRSAACAPVMALSDLGYGVARDDVRVGCLGSPDRTDVDL
jgi:hypothetical protein